MKIGLCPYRFFNYFLLKILLCVSLFSNAQSKNYQFRFIGLPGNFKNQFITFLDEDAAGMLWFVTNNGLHRYDGNQVLTFDRQSNPSLPDININYLFADSRSHLWVATQKHLVRFDLKTWTTKIIPFPDSLFLNSHDRIISFIGEGKDGSVYFASGNGTLFTCDGSSLHLLLKVKPLASSGNVAGNAIRTIVEPTKGQLWLTTGNGQVIHLSLLEHKPPVYYELKEFKKTGINFLAFGGNTKCLLYADEAGAFLFDSLSGKLTPLPPPQGITSFQKSANFPVALENGKVAFFFSGSSPGLRGFGIYDFKDGFLTTLNTPYPASFKASIFRKVTYKNRKIYISTDRGIAAVSYLNNPFEILGADLENINSVRTIYKVKDDGLFIGSYKEKFTQLKESTNETKFLSDQMVSCLIPWGNDSLLAGTEGRFPMWYFPTSNRFEPVSKMNSSVNMYNVNKYVLCLLKENDSLAWAGTYMGCYLFNPVTGAVLKQGLKESGFDLQQSNVTDIIKSGSSRFFATQRGIFKYNTVTGNAARLFERTGSGYASDRYNCLQLVGNKLWAGSNGNGILIFDTAGTVIKRITTADGLASNIVYSLPVSKKFVLAGTSKGLSIIEESSGKIHSYSSQHYLPSNEFNRSAWLVKGDTIYMGTTNGVIRFSLPLTEQAPVQTSPPVRITSFSLNNGDETKLDYTLTYAANPSLVIPAGTKSFSINFGGLDDAAAEMNLFYRFAGDSAWQNIGQQREVTFVNLSPGRYNIQIAARLPDGNQVGNLLLIPIDVQPRFYQTSWFKILLALIGFATVWLVIKYRENTLRKEQQLRSRIAGDLHDEVGSALTRIYFQADSLSAKNDLPQLQKIVSSSQEALSSMSDMVWSIDAHYDNASDMIARMKDYIARLQDEFDCKCRFEISGHYEKRPVSQVSRQNIFLIFKEAISNALKYGLDKTVDIEIIFEKNRLMMIIENKIATAPNQVRQSAGGHGLKSMQLRADKINAALNISQDDSLFSVKLVIKN